jgi:hypothetical protein
MEWNAQGKGIFVGHFISLVKGCVEKCMTKFRIDGLSMKNGQQSTEGYTHDGRLIGRGARDQEPDGNRDIRHKIYTGLGHQYDVKPYIMCSVILY